MRVTTMSWIDLIGYAASASVLATFCMNTMVPLRVVAICSNILFAIFGALAHVYPVLLLHVILLPVNGVRLRQAILRQRKRGPAPGSMRPLEGCARQGKGGGGTALTAEGEAISALPAQREEKAACSRASERVKSRRSRDTKQLLGG